MEMTDIITFVMFAALLVISPGPNGFLIAKTVSTSGRSAGFANLIGFVVAFFLHGALSVLGISIILVKSAMLFTIVKYLGAAYLIWVGINSLISAFCQQHAGPRIDAASKVSTINNPFLTGFLTNALNPKVAMFYLAAFPQFIPVGEASIGAASLLVVLHVSIAFIWFMALILLFSRVASWSGNPIVSRWIKGVTGAVFVLFGVQLSRFSLG